MIRTEYCAASRSAGCSDHEQVKKERETADLLLLHEMADKASDESIHCSSFSGLLPCRDALTSLQLDERA